MLYQTLAVLLCSLYVLQEADCRLHRHQRYREEDRHHRVTDHLNRDEDRHHRVTDHLNRDEDSHHRVTEHLNRDEVSHHRVTDHMNRDEDRHQKDEAQERRDELLALEHSERVAESGTCGVPSPQVVHVTDHYPGRYFLPHCTVLHRCGRHSGCCGTDRLRCVALEKQKVVLPFYSVRMEEVLPGGRAVRRVEKLEFSNHTRCGCAPDLKSASRNDL